METLGLLGSSPTQSYNNHYHTPTHQHPLDLGQHCQLRLGGNHRLTQIITYTIIQQPLPYTNIHWAWGNVHCQLRMGGNPRLGSLPTQSYNNHYHTPTHQHPVGLGQHCQLRLGGNPRLTRIITYTIIQQPLPYTNTSRSNGLGAKRSAEAGCKS